MNMPTYQGAIESNYSGGAPARLQSDVQSLAPLATTFVTPQAPSFGVGTTPTSRPGGVMANIGHFIGSIGSTIGYLGVSAEQWLQHETTKMVLAPVHYGEGLAHAYLDNKTLDSINKNTAIVSARIDNLHNMLKSGQISAQEYTAKLKDANQEMSQLLKDSSSINTRIKSDFTDAKQATIDTASALLTVMTFGLGGEAAATDLGLSRAGVTLTPDVGAKTAGEWLLSKEANPLMQPVENALAKIGLDTSRFKALTPSAQQAINKSTAEVIATGAPMTAGQIARASAANLALKYPLMYAYLSGTGTEIYKELQDKKYGAAINTLALNAAIAVGGGILGEGALALLGKGARGATAAVFSKSAFMDVLSKELFGDSEALFKGAVGNQARIKALSDLEATHMHATNGDPVAAAWRVINGERAVDGVNAIDKGPEGWLDHNIKWANSAKRANSISEKLGLGPVSVGRWTSNNARMVATELSKSDSPEGRLEIWKSLKQQYSDSAFANNTNLDAQITHYINTVKDSKELGTKINQIKAGRFVSGFPEADARIMAKDGFLPINGAKHSASYVEGSGTLASKHANGEEFFTKAVPPLPVLGSVGAFFTKMGLSPYASTVQVHDLYNSNLAKNLKGTSVAKKVANFLNEKGLTKSVKAPEVSSSSFSKQELRDLQKQGYTPEMIAKLEKGQFSEGEAPTQGVKPNVPEGAPSKDEKDGADYIRKLIASYANSPNRRYLASAKIADERQMTQKDLITAFANRGITITRSEATEIQNAISRAHLDISTTVKGAGDKLVDFLYAAPGLRVVERRFLRLQGSMRFTFNPFFQYLRAVPKLEILSEAEGGGFVKSIFLGRTKQMREVKEGLRTAGFLNETGTLGKISTDESLVADMGRNLHKQLLPAQENSIAGLVDSLSQKAGVTWQEYIAQNPDKTRDVIQAIAEYDRKGDFINSPLARTLNIAFFPFRFETKVLQIMTKSLVRQDYLTKVAVIQGVAKAHDFLSSPQGQAWYQQNADAIGMFKYITPVASFNEVFHSLLPGNDHSLGNFGELGGLPFGMIPQLLDAEGLTQFNQPGVNPKTGVVYNQYVPATAKGQIAIAIQDLLGSMFSYPGATAGLPSKTSITRNTALGIVGGSKNKDLKSVTPQSPQAQMVDALLHGPQSDNVPPSATQTAPARESSLTVPKFKTGSGSSKTKKLKKSEFVPELLPGQTKLGQL